MMNDLRMIDVQKGSHPHRKVSLSDRSRTSEERFGER